jgi:hypothetical protein
MSSRSIEQEVRVGRLLGRRVFAQNSRNVGRLEEFRLERHGDDWTITDYVIGGAGLLERLGLGFKLLFGLHVGGRLARWDQVDISDPARPRLTCSVRELRPLTPDQ